MAKTSKTQKKGRATRAPKTDKKKSKHSKSWPRADELTLGGMTGYLVIWRHTMDDVPVGLYSTRAAALKAAKTMSFFYSYAQAHALDIDCETPICFAVVCFKDGQAKQIIHVDREDDM